MKKLSLVCASLSMIVCLASGTMPGQQQQQQKRCKDWKPNPEWPVHVDPEDIKHLPEITSRVEGISIESATLENIGTPQATLVLTIRNNTNLSVMGLDAFTETPSKGDSAMTSTSSDSFSSSSTLLDAYESKAFSYRPGDLLDFQYPIAIATGTFMNGLGDITEAGDPKLLELNRLSRERSKALQEKEIKPRDYPN